MDTRTIFFNEEKHRYTDQFGNVYISATTLIGKYEQKEDFVEIAKRCEKIGRNPNHPKFKKYKNKTYKQILKGWNKEKVKGCKIGNEKHNFLEDSVNLANGYQRVKGGYINDKIYTIPDVIKHHDYGRINMDTLSKCKVDIKYPEIYELIGRFVDNGYKIYAEIGTYNAAYLVSGLIDILAVKNDNFIIIDWKTNKAKLRYEAGYYAKDNDGNLTDEFIEKNVNFKYPLNNVSQSIGYKYTLQLSLYDYLTEQYGLNCKGNILCHIRHHNHTSKTTDRKDLIGKQVVDILPIKYLKNDIVSMLEHNHSKRKLKNQNKLFNV